MNVNNPPISSTGAAEVYKRQDIRTQGAQLTGAAAHGSSGQASSIDDVHLSELVRSLRALAADSPERQNKIEQIARAYASGRYQIDAHATADGIIRDATHS